MLLYHHLMAQCLLKVGRKSKSEAWNLPTIGCKSMMEGLTIMLGVFIILLYTYIMPNNHYSSTFYGVIAPLDGQTMPESRQKIEIWRETCQQGAVKVITLIQTQTMIINHYRSNWIMIYRRLMPNVSQKLAGNRDFFQSEARNRPPSCGCKSIIEGPTNMLWVFITLLYIHTMSKQAL